MMGGVSPETRAACKYGIIKFWYIVASFWIFLYELYYDARIHEHQVVHKVALGQVFVQVPLSVSISPSVSLYMLLVAEKQTADSWEPYKKQRPLENQEALVRKVLSH